MIDEDYGSIDIFNEEWELYKTDYQIDLYNAGLKLLTSDNVILSNCY